MYSTFNEGKSVVAERFTRTGLLMLHLILLLNTMKIQIKGILNLKLVTM